MKPTLLSFLTPKNETMTIPFNSTVRQVIERMDYHKFTIVPLLDDSGHYIGTISEGDILRFIKNEKKFDMEAAQDCHISQIERYRSYGAVKIDTSLETLRDTLLNQNFVPVIDDRDMFIGIIKRKSVMEYFFKKYKNLED